MLLDPNRARGYHRPKPVKLNPETVRTVHAAVTYAMYVLVIEYQVKEIVAKAETYNRKAV